MSKIDLPHDHGNTPKKLRVSLPAYQTFDRVSDVLKLMSDTQRIRIFWLLCHCEECVINLSALLGMSSSAVSHHLQMLKAAGLVISRREGKEVYYTTAETLTSGVLHDMIERVVEVACPTEDIPHAQQEYDSAVQIVNQVHGLLTSDLTKRYTVEELSVQFHINQTTLKTAFKTVYGKPIAAYMKDYRIKKATELLTGSDKSIAETAYSVGYENPGKFTQAYKSVTGILPKEVRKAKFSNE